jgi:hypothetical protein
MSTAVYGWRAGALVPGFASLRQYDFVPLQAPKPVKRTRIERTYPPVEHRRALTPLIPDSEL